MPGRAGVYQVCGILLSCPSLGNNGQGVGKATSQEKNGAPQRSPFAATF
jgi:hypothetical protein